MVTGGRSDRLPQAGHSGVVLRGVAVGTVDGAESSTADGKHGGLGWPSWIGDLHGVPAEVPDREGWQVVGGRRVRRQTFQAKLDTALQPLGVSLSAPWR